MLGLQAGPMLSGTAPAESVLGWPDLGVLKVQAVARCDYPLPGMFLLKLVMVIVANALADLVCIAINPRLRAHGQSARCPRHRRRGGSRA
ncbi:MAG: ABC transporter permease subunit [Paracoccus sp. (in: a-proteobacteria)]|uniref:ABC transporter permease subunit n=1 Tax=Paracoccus sp. TaxID=267 RepID=UPI0039E2AAF1